VQGTALLTVAGGGDGAAVVLLVPYGVALSDEALAELLRWALARGPGGLTQAPPGALARACKVARRRLPREESGGGGQSEQTGARASATPSRGLSVLHRRAMFCVTLPIPPASTMSHWSMP